MGKLFWQGRWDNYFGKIIVVGAREFLNNGMWGVYSLRLVSDQWSPPDDPARPCRPKASYGLVMMMMMIYPSSATAHLHVNGAWLYWNMIEIINNKFKECHHGATRPFITVWHWKIKMVILAAQANSLMIHLGRVPTTTKNLLGHLPDLSYLWKKFSRNKNVTL